MGYFLFPAFISLPSESPTVAHNTPDRAAELLDAIPVNDAQLDDPGADHMSTVFSPNPDLDEAQLEAQEFSKYLLAKSFFDCREFDRCAAVFLPDSILSGVIEPTYDALGGTPNNRAKDKAGAVPPTSSSRSALPVISQKSLFLALYAKFMSGEKRKDEDSEMVMGPQDLGTVVNKQLLPVSRFLNRWFEERTTEDGEVVGSQGWLEYL